MSKIIRVNVAIDTARLMADFPDPSTDLHYPTDIPYTDPTWVLVTDTDTGPETKGDIDIKASPEDMVRVFLLSESDNRDNSAILYKLSLNRGNNVFRTADFSIQPASGTVPVQPVPGPKDARFAQNTIIRKNSAAILLQFAVYRADLSLHGYFCWDINMAIH